MSTITLTIKEIQDLAMFAGIAIDESKPVDADQAEATITIGPCPEVGLRDGDAGHELRRHYRMVAFFEEYPEEGCHGLGPEIEVNSERRDAEVEGALECVVRRVPVDFKSVAAESGLSRGNLCYLPEWGWCVKNTHGEPGPDIAVITASELEEGETRLAVENGIWCFYGPQKCERCGSVERPELVLDGGLRMEKCPQCGVLSER